MPALLLIGCGKMGSAMLHSWQDKDFFSDIHVVDAQFNTPAVTCVKSCAELPPALTPDIACIAVKPQDFGSIQLPETIKPKLVLSIMAGITLQQLQSAFPHSVVIRAMPNLPASIGAGATVACTSQKLETADKQLVDAMLNATGYSAWVEDEALLDAVTALSGSGPAYVFRLIEVMAEAGVKIGLPEELAQELAKHTVIGASKLAEGDISATELRQNVTSKGGTTEAALNTLDAENVLQRLFTTAMEAATKRSKELAHK